MVFNRYIQIILYLTLYFNVILCDIPLINYIEPLSQNDSIISIYGRFFGKDIQEVKVEFNLGNGFEMYNISEWTPTNLIIKLNPPLPKEANLRLSVLQHTINYNVTFMNPYCLGINQCNGHGVCPTGRKCECLEPWSGDDCSKIEGEDMLKFINIKKKVVPLPNHLDRFQTSIGLVLKEITINGYVINSYLLAPSQEYGSINSGDFLVNRYKTNTFMSSANQPFNCDITLNHYLSNQTSNIGTNYIYQIKDGIGLAVIVRNFISKSSTNKLKLYLYPMVVQQSLSSINETTAAIETPSSSMNNETLSSSYSNETIATPEIPTTTKMATTTKVAVTKIDNDDIPYSPNTTINKNKYDTVNMVIGNQKLVSNIYDFGLILGSQATFNTSVEKLYNVSNLESSNNDEIKLYSIISISAIPSKYLYFFSDYYPTKIEELNNKNNNQIPTPINNNNNNTKSPSKQPEPKLTTKPSDNQHILEDNDTPPSQSSIKPSPTQPHINDFNVYESNSFSIKFNKLSTFPILSLTSSLSLVLINICIIIFN